MIILDAPQGSIEWLAARLGKPTASNFDKVITEAKGEPSSSMRKYAMTLIADSLLGYPSDDAKSSFMQRGQIIETAARSWYELKRDVDVRQVGFIMRDDEKVGCSPDGLVEGTSLTEGNGLVEIKCPSLPVHLDYLLSGAGIKGYKAQVQGQLWICERDWCDTVSYCPGFPNSLVRQYRDDRFIKKLDDCIKELLDMMREEYAKLALMGCHPKAYTPPNIWDQVDSQQVA